MDFKDTIARSTDILIPHIHTKMENQIDLIATLQIDRENNRPKWGRSLSHKNPD